MDSDMRTQANKKTQWTEGLVFAIMLSWLRLSKCYAPATPMTGVLVISVHILDSFQKSEKYGRWDKGMDINPKDEALYSTQYQEILLMFLENEYCTKHTHVPVLNSNRVLNNILSPSTTASGSIQSFFVPYYVSSDDEEYFTIKDVAERLIDKVIVQHAYWSLARSIWIHWLNQHKTGGKSIRISMIITLTH